MAKSCSAPDRAPEAQSSCSSPRLPQVRREMSQPQENTGGIVAAFYPCAQNCSPLSRQELRQLMEQEFGDAMENPQDPESIRKVLCFLGDGNDCGVGLRELLSLVFHVAKACYKPLQQQQEMGDGEGVAGEGEKLLWPHTEGRESHNQQVPERGVENQDQDTEIQDQNIEIQDQNIEIQDQNIKIQDQDLEIQDQDTHQSQQGETAEQETQQIQEGETAEQDQDTPQGDGTEAPEGDPEKGEILEAATPERDRNTCEDEEGTKEDPKTHQAPENEGPGEGSTHHEGPEPKPAKQDPNPPPETRGKDPQKTQVCEAPWKDPNPGQDAKAQGTLWGPDGHQIPESKGLETEQSEAQQLQGRPVVEQQLLQPLYQWPPEQ